MTITLDVTNVLFGIANPNDDHIIDILNLCILYGKWYIHQCKQEGDQIFLMNYIKVVKDKLTAEKTLCILNSTKYLHEEFLNFLDML